MEPFEQQFSTNISLTAVLIVEIISMFTDNENISVFKHLHVRSFDRFYIVIARLNRFMAPEQLPASFSVLLGAW